VCPINLRWPIHFEVLQVNYSTKSHKTRLSVAAGYQSAYGCTLQPNDSRGEISEY